MNKITCNNCNAVLESYYVKNRNISYLEMTLDIPDKEIPYVIDQYDETEETLAFICVECDKELNEDVIEQIEALFI